jgi:2-oxoisovalerate dehydrogenase E1 component
MVIRVAGLAYQKGFGGHFHNDNSLAVFRDIPGVVIACPSNGRDAQKLLRDAVRIADQQQRVVIFLEPIALYMAKDLHQEGDGLWTFDYQAPDTFPSEPEMTVAVNGQGQDLCILSYGNGFYLSMQAQRVLAERGIDCRVVDLRWLAPLDVQGVIEHANACSNILIVDECRQTGSISEALMTMLAEHNLLSGDKAVKRVCAQDSFIPLGSAAYHVLPSKEEIIEQALALCDVTKEHVGVAK